MGAWGTGTFDNDTACDWALSLEGGEDLSRVRETLDAVLEEEDYLDSDPASEALAACEVVARLKGNWGVRDSYSEPADRWVEAHPQPVPPELVAKAVAAIDRVLTPPSELPDLWDEGKDPDGWRAAVADLRRRVES